MSSYELTFAPERPQRNAVTGRFLPGHKTHNKGKSWDEYIPREAQERCRKGFANVLPGSPYRVRPVTSGVPPRPVMAIDDKGRARFLPSIEAAARFCGANPTVIKRCCRDNASGIPNKRFGVINSDRSVKGYRFYFEADTDVWTAKVDRPIER